MLLVGREVAGGVPPLQLLQGEGAGVWSQSLGVGGKIKIPIPNPT